jgi:heme O synthase-like polyprenyltransferase
MIVLSASTCLTALTMTVIAWGFICLGIKFLNKEKKLKSHTMFLIGLVPIGLLCINILIENHK